MISESAPQRQRGLTLLEMMVVLLVAGMAISLAFQSLGQWRRANAAFSTISGAVQQSTLTQSWLEASLRGLIPIQEHAFQGTPSAALGVSTQPVQSQQGGALAVEWSIRIEEGLLHLVLKEGEKEALDLPLPGAVGASFGYMDSEGRMHAQWPPKLGLHAHLPAVIVLKLDLDDGRQRIWGAAISGARNPHFNPYEIEVD